MFKESLLCSGILSTLRRSSWSGMIPQKVLKLGERGSRIGATQTERGEGSGSIGITRGDGKSLATANGGEKSGGKTIARAGGVHRLHGKTRGSKRALR